MAVGVEHESAVVVRVIMQAQAGRAVVFAAGGERGLVEGVYQRAVFGAERDVDARRLRRALMQPEIRLRRDTHSEHHRPARELDRNLHQHFVTERSQRRLVETPTQYRVTDVQSRVIDHGDVFTTTLRLLTARPPSRRRNVPSGTDTTLPQPKFYGAVAAGKVVSKRLLSEMLSKDPNVAGTDYTMGLFRWEKGRKFLGCDDFVGHPGGIPGYASQAYSSVDGKRQFAIAVNSFTLDEKAGEPAAQLAFRGRSSTRSRASSRGCHSSSARSP